MAKINLLPWRENLRQQRQKNFMISLGVAVLVAAALVMMANHLMNVQISGQDARNNFLRAEIRKLDRDIQRIEQLEEVRESLISRKEIIERLQSNRTATVHLFNQLARTVPEGITLNSVRQTQERLTILGTSESETRVSEYMRNIEAAAWLSDPRLRIVERSPSSDRPAQPYRFELSARIAPPETDEEAF
ncbi:MAG: PilN domain-containing protein [Wenzhouxiangella sp.]